MPRLISSPLTIMLKLLIVPVWIGFFILLTALLITQNGDPWVLLGSWIFIVLFGIPVFLFCVPLKRVLIDGNQLVVSNFVKKTRIDASNIADVTEITWLAPHPVLDSPEESHGFWQEDYVHARLFPKCYV